VLILCIIDAEEHRDVAVVDIPNAFVQTRVENEKDMAFIKIRGILVDILVEIKGKITIGAIALGNLSSIHSCSLYKV
jgi:hypothetical protein